MNVRPISPLIVALAIRWNKSWLAAMPYPQIIVTEGICKYCGERFISIRKANNKFTKYCSSECSVNDRFGEEISDGTFIARSEAGLAALHLVQSGHMVTRAAKEAGIHPFALHSLIRKNKSVFSGRTCRWCEKPLIGMKNLSVRLYCSAKCKDAVKKSIMKRKNPPYKLAALREEGILLYKEGYSINEIAKHLEVGTNRVGGWVEDFIGKKEKAFLKKRNSAKTADEWLQALREFNPNHNVELSILVSQNKRKEIITRTTVNTIYAA